MAETITNRIRGTLRGEHIYDRAWGFLNPGPGKPDYFIHRNQVPPEAWVYGAVMEFLPQRPKPGTKNPRAGGKIVVISVPEVHSDELAS